MAPFHLWQTNSSHDRNNDFANGIIATDEVGFLDPPVGRNPQFEKS